VLPKKLLLFLTFAMLGPPVLGQTEYFRLTTVQSLEDLEKEKYQKVNKLVDFFYNNFESVEKNLEAKKNAWDLLQNYPDDPYLYDLWATIEWASLGHELGTGLDQQKDVSEFPKLVERAKKYHVIVDQGLRLTDDKNNTESQLARAVLFFDQAKFTFSFESNTSSLSQVDKETAEGIKTLKQILEKDSALGPAYFFLGITRYGLAAKTESWSPKRLVIRLASYVYYELYSLDNDVFNKSSALDWVEKGYHYTCLYPWLKKVWLESALLLFKIYPDYRKGLKLNKELEILETKEVPLLENLAEILPNRQDVLQGLKLSKLRVRILKDYLSSQKK